MWTEDPRVTQPAAFKATECSPLVEGLSWGACSALVLLGLMMVTGGCGSERGRRTQRRPTSAPAPEAPRLVRAVSASLRGYVASIPRMGQESRDYRAPGEGTLVLARRALARLAAGQPEEASLLLGAIGFQVVELHEGLQRYYVVREPAGRPIRGWGVYVLNPAPARPYLLEAPHPQNDLYTDTQALWLFHQLGARALILSTAYRCATDQASPCSGKTRACAKKRRRQPFRLSDMGHTDQSIFQMAHEVLFDSSADSVVVQLHGFDRRPDRRVHLLVSDGTRRRAPRAARSNRLVRLLRKRLKRRRGAMSCNEYRNRPLPPLCGTLSVQGRHANGSADPCRKRTRKSRDRFLHIEQSLDARRPGGRVEPSVLLQALAELVPTPGETEVER